LTDRLTGRMCGCGDCIGICRAFRTIEEQGGATGCMFAEALDIPAHVLEETIQLSP
jgi:hypothetical protein